jgi:N-formylmaleamate deformylase
MSTFQYGGNVTANGIRQHYLRYGGATAIGGDPVIVLPGITSPAATWAFVGERLGRQFDTYVLDIRGRGLSSAGVELDYSLDAQAADVIAFAEAVGIERYSIVGHSMGARIGIRAASSHPARLARLVMVDPPVSGPGRRPYPAKLPWYMDSIRLSLAGIDADGMRAFCPTWSDAHLRLRAEWLHTCDERAILESFNAFGTDDIHTDLPRLKVPALLITAGRGDVVLPSDLAEFKSLVPQLATAHVANAGHMIPWDDEEGFYCALGSFLGTAVSA